MNEIILIVGGGIAGLEAAGKLLQLGYTPIIVEKGDRLGGNVARWHRLFPDMTPASEVVGPLIENAKGANIFLNTEISFINRLKDKYNVMLSSGISIICRYILLTTGFELFDARKKEEYGYGIYDQVITNSDLEAWFNTGADTRVGKVHDGGAVGFVHCVGSRDEKALNPQCSKVCCITAIKQAIEMKERYPDLQVYCFYMDLRLFGKKYEDFYARAQRDYGIRFIRGRVSEVCENIEGKVIIKAEDTLSGKPVRVTLDLLVLMAGMKCNQDGAKIGNMIYLPIDTDGFLQSKDNISRINTSPTRGFYYAGACTGPKTIPETLAEARAAALEIHTDIINSRK